MLDFKVSKRVSLSCFSHPAMLSDISLKNEKIQNLNFYKFWFRPAKQPKKKQEQQKNV